jgi:hypothetical protein
MPRTPGRASLRAAVALAALGTFIIAGSNAQASFIGGFSSARISVGNGSYVGTRLPLNPIQPNVGHPGTTPPLGHPHPGGTKQNVRIQ